MANLQCLPATDITTQSATLHGTGDNIPVGNSLRIDYSFTQGGPYGTLGTPVAGTGAAGQSIDQPIVGLANLTPYYYVVVELDAGNNIIDTSEECTFTTLDYNVTCEVNFVTQTSVNITVCADFVSDGLGGKDPQFLQVVSSPNPGGPYNTLEAQVPGTFVDNQCQNFNITDLGPCETRYFKGRVSPVPAEYEVDWAYSHMARTNGTEQVEFRLGDQADYIANGGEPNGYNAMTIVDTDTSTGELGVWHRKTGTFPVPSGTTQLHMGFKSILPGGGSSVGNFLDACSIVLRRVIPSPLVIGEQIINGSFEFPESPIGPGGVWFVGEEPATPGIAWRTTDPTNVLEYWEGPNNSTDGGALNAYPDGGDQWAELDAFNPGELYQIVDLAVGFVESEVECPATSILVTCNLPSNITETSAVLNGTYCSPPGFFVAFQYTEDCLNKPLPVVWDHQSPLIPSEGVGGPFPISYLASPLECGTQYCFRTVLYDEDLNEVAASDDDGPIACLFFTNDCGAQWCGGSFDQGDCTLVVTPNGSYFNCNQV